MLRRLPSTLVTRLSWGTWSEPTPASSASQTRYSTGRPHSSLHLAVSKVVKKFEILLSSMFLRMNCSSFAKIDFGNIRNKSEFGEILHFFRVKF
jgi:hypothetical protein